MPALSAGGGSVRLLRWTGSPGRGRRERPLAKDAPLARDLRALLLSLCLLPCAAVAGEPSAGPMPPAADIARPGGPSGSPPAPVHPTGDASPPSPPSPAPDPSPPSSPPSPTPDPSPPSSPPSPAPDPSPRYPLQGLVLEKGTGQPLE
jgi:hypothetical protein